MASSKMTEARGSQRIDDEPHLDDEVKRRLKALSISTVEELEGAYRAAPNAMSSALPMSGLDRLIDDYRDGISSFRFRAGGEPEVAEVGFGALPPPDVDLPGFISPEWFEDYLTRVDEPPAQLPSGALVPGNVEADAPAAEGALEPARVNLIGELLPVRRQGSRWTCVGHAVGALLEHRFRVEQPVVSLSPQFLYWASKQVDGGPEDRGTWIEFCLGEAATRGAATEAAWPYNPEVIPGNEAQGPPPDAALVDASRRLAPPRRQLGTRTGRLGLTPQAMVDALAAGNPVAFSVATPEAIWKRDDQVRQTGFVTMPLPGTEVSSAHAMLAVGYGEDDDIPGRIYVVFRNSWGPEWAPDNPFGRGYGVMPLAYVQEWGLEAYTC